SLDTIGVLARDVEDAELISDVLTGQTWEERDLPNAPPAIGVCKTVLWERAEPETVEALQAAREGLVQAGARVDEVEMPRDFTAVDEARAVINAVERARSMAFEWAHYRGEISATLGETLAEGTKMPYVAYAAALETCREMRGRLPALFGERDALLVPCVPGAAPIGLDSTGDPAFQGFWTALHVPSITLPTYRTADGLPVGVQLVARPREDRALLAAARWAMAQLEEPEHAA
ncbi:MAG TPA: amidase family protein, partial [Alphaproteobacteria bacterium]|nr:amidase family protein [Alphaproteobacteria bacterium]